MLRLFAAGSVRLPAMARLLSHRTLQKLHLNLHLQSVEGAVTERCVAMSELLQKVLEAQ